MLTRPRGLHEAWSAVGGGLLMLLLGLETWQQAWQTVAQGSDVLLFLFALMLLSALLDASGFFEWAAVQSARLARGSGQALFRNVFLLGALITAFLSLDTTAIILTPIVLAFVSRLNLKPMPFLIACAFVANTGSLLLPVSNLTNLLFQSRFHLSFAPFALHMLLPQAVAVVVNYGVLRWLFRKDLAADFSPETLPDPARVVPDQVFFRGAVLVLGAIFVGYFIGSVQHVPPYLIALAGCGVLGVLGLVRRRVEGRKLLGGISWALFPFVIGLFVVVRGVENLGIAPLAARGLAHVGPSALGQVFVTAFGAGLGSNVVNNIPMALLSLSVLAPAHAHDPSVYGALLGCDIGPNLTIVGSLATMLVLSSARQRGEDVRGADFFRVGLVATPLILLAACLALWVTLRL
jgi:arsenical pump membrane protein